MCDKMYIIFFGPPGAGKGTYAGILSERLGLFVLATGDLLREAVERGTELGRKAQKYMLAGELVPDEIIMGVVEEALRSKDAERGVIFDGFPRTIRQAEMLDALLEKMGRKVDLVVELLASDELVVRRLSSRRVCPKCGRIYNLVSNPPKVDEICDYDGAKLIQRDDDKPETILNRLEVYRRQTAPLLGYYRRKDVAFVTLDTSGTIDEGKEELFSKLRGMGIAI